MSDTVNLNELPEHIRAQIIEAQQPKKPLFPIEPREAGGNFQTKEIKEFGEKIDLLIEAVNTLWEKQQEPILKKAK